MLHHKHGHRALERIAEQRRGGEAFAAGAQDVGRADIAGTDGADVGGPGQPGQNQAEWNRAAEIPERQRGAMEVFSMNCECSRPRAGVSIRPACGNENRWPRRRLRGQRRCNP